MPDNSINNKRIAKNTLFLYLRMIIVMGIGLYTVRAILDLLGVVDYGIYNVVGGVVAMFSFINGTLATSSQRYFSIELAKGDMKRLNQWFCLNITTFSIFILLFIAIAETIGLWFVNTQMTIPAERMLAANVVYQFSIITFCIHFFNVPYNALIIAHERMNAFAYISIVEALCKLGIVFVLTYISWDRLIIYGLLMFLTSCGVTSSYIIYSHRFFAESRFHYYWNRQEIKNLFGFSSWHLLGTLSVVIRSQGINILINLFFNPAVNAARAVAYQINTAIGQLSNNFFIAVKPEMYKSYATGQMSALHKLVIRSSVICIFLISVLNLPFYVNTSFILGLWLKEIPEYAIIFTQLVLINGLIDSPSGSTICPALATGRIKKFYLYTSGIYILNLPVSFIFLKFGYDATITMLVSICLSFVALIIRAYLLIGLINFPFSNYMKIIGRTIIATLFILFTLYGVCELSDNKWMTLFTTILVSTVLHVILYMFFIFEKSDRMRIIAFAVSKIQHKRQINYK